MTSDKQSVGRLKSYLCNVSSCNAHEMGNCLQVWNYCRWKYAGNSVLEVHIRRHTQMWSWSNIKQHRHLLKCYKNMYKNKLTQSKLSEETQKQIQVCVVFFPLVSLHQLLGRNITVTAETRTFEETVFRSHYKIII